MPIILVSDTRLFGEEKFCGFPFVLKYVVRLQKRSCDEKCRVVLVSRASHPDKKSQVRQTLEFSVCLLYL